MCGYIISALKILVGKLEGKRARLISVKDIKIDLKEEDAELWTRGPSGDLL
jgi:hypothetical protein